MAGRAYLQKNERGYQVVETALAMDHKSIAVTRKKKLIGQTERLILQSMASIQHSETRYHGTRRRCDATELGPQRPSMGSTGPGEDRTWSSGNSRWSIFEHRVVFSIILVDTTAGTITTAVLPGGRVYGVPYTSSLLPSGIEQFLSKRDLTIKAGDFVGAKRGHWNGNRHFPRQCKRNLSCRLRRPPRVP